jgi:DNA-binding beta-propeller fold protein YncE
MTRATPMTRGVKAAIAIATLVWCTSVFAQSAPEIAYDAADILKFPDNVHLGEAAGVATNSRGQIFVYTRTGAASAALGSSRTFYKYGSRLFQFDPNGRFVKEIGQGVYGLNFAQSVRIDPQDNIWVVDQGSSNVIKFDPDGRIQLVLSRKPEAVGVRPPAAGTGRGGPALEGRGGPAEGRGGPAPEGRGGPPAGVVPVGGAPAGRGAAGPGAGIPCDSFNRTADVTWDRAGNIYVADGASRTAGNARIAKFDRDGHFIKSWGSRGSDPGQFNSIRGIVADGQANLYVADAGNNRIQVFDAEGTVKSQISNVGVPSALCITPGAHQYLYSSNSNDPETLDAGEIYKLELDGRIVGRFGKAGKLSKEFGSVNSIDCRIENELFVAELTNWRVQKVTLHPGK